MSYKLKSRFWIETEKGPFLGMGRVELLEKIEQAGSISKAAAEMGMSYAQAWKLVESMNAKATRPLVEKQTGGKGGGGAFLTEEGQKAIALFRQIQSDFQTFIVSTEKKLNI